MAVLQGQPLCSLGPSKHTFSAALLRSVPPDNPVSFGFLLALCSDVHAHQWDLIEVWAFLSTQLFWSTQLTCGGAGGRWGDPG